MTEPNLETDPLTYQQEIKVVSTQEVEYMAYLEAGWEAVWLRSLRLDLTTRMGSLFEASSLSLTAILSDNTKVL